ncbi:MAG: response regulator [Ruminococcus sp.]
MRHNLLIVDDEELIRQGLKARLEYLGIDVDKIFEASNGNEAIEVVKNHTVDIVVTDIRMPDMDGLTLIREVQKIEKNIQFVVLSGYAEFTYAEQAIRLGVKSYLLKPVSNEELKNTFQKLYADMERLVQIQNAVRMKRQLDREKQEYVLEKEINTFLSTTEERIMSVDLLCQLSGIPTEKGDQGRRKMYFCMIRVNKESYENKRFRQVDHELIRFSIKNVFYELETSCKKFIVNSLSDYNHLYALFFGEDEKVMREEIERLFLKMRSVLEVKMDSYLTYGVSKATEQMRGKAVSEAQDALKQRIIYGNSNIYFHEDIVIWNEQEFPRTQIHLLKQYLERSEADKIQELLQEIFSEELVQRYGSSYLRIMWVRILNMIFQYFDGKGSKTISAEELLSNFNLPEHMQSLAEIRQKISEILMDRMKTEGVSEVRARSRIQMAVRYIHEHYSENITILDLAERYEMSPNYFSSIFKREIGVSAVNYITDVRMKEAQKLLAHSDNSVVDIAKKVGYEDGQYFFRVFKKHTGMTPLRYREENRR